MLTTVAAGALAAVGGAVSWVRSARAANAYYDGPLSDHFDGVRFFLPGYPFDKTSGEVLRWNLTRAPAHWPLDFPSPFQDRPTARVGRFDLRITLIGHASFLVQTGGLNLLIDPVYSERVSPVSFAGPRRVNPPGIAFDDLPPIDWVLLTHNHYDHLDLDTLLRLEQRFAPQFLAPLGNDAILRAGGITGPVITRDWGEGEPLSDGVGVDLVPAKHWSARGLFDRRHALWASFILKTPAGIVYHIGDTGYLQSLFTDVRRRYGAPRLLVLPIGAYEPRWFMRDQHMNPAEAVQALRLCGARRGLGHHWGTFPLTAEGPEAPRLALAHALEEAGVAADAFRAVRPGGVHILEA